MAKLGKQWGVVIGCWCVTLVLAVTGVCLALTIPSKAVDDETFVRVAEIWENPNHVQELYNALTGQSGATLADVKALVPDADSAFDAAQIRANNNEKNIILTFGGQEWHVCYLSNDTDGNPILTLWALNSVAENLRPFIGGVTNDSEMSNIADPECRANYNTWYSRAVVNNGGRYIGEQKNEDTGFYEHCWLEYEPVTDYALQEFLPGGKYATAIVTPQHVAWQTERQSSTNRHNLNIKLDDNLWLPHTLEIGYDYQLQSTPSYGNWRLNTNGNAQGPVAELSLLRGAFGYDYVYQVRYVQKNGSSYYTPLKFSPASVVPALHLNLNADELHVHDYQETKVVPATCIEQGYTKHTCICGDSYQSDFTAKIDHDWGEWVTAQEPTATKEGLAKRQCQYGCGTTEQKIIAALGGSDADTNHDTVKTWAIVGGVSGGVLVLGGGTISWLYIIRKRKSLK